MKLFAGFSVLLILGLLVDPGLPVNFISQNDCVALGAHCSSEECGTDMIFHGLCEKNVSCCKRDPIPYCKKRGGTCIDGECAKDATFLGKCSMKRTCCRK